MALLQVQCIVVILNAIYNIYNTTSVLDISTHALSKGGQI